jgi:hypothetical protein
MESMFFRRQQPKEMTFEDLLQSVREAGFETERQPDGRVKVSRSGCAAIVSEGPRVECAGWLVGAEIAALVDGGYQKFWRAGNRSVPALAAQLKALHAFEEDLREALGLESFYNASLGTTNDLHVYDRVAGRESSKQ